MSPGELVRAFYDEVWNRDDAARARELLDPAFRFRGSLGQERNGPDGFIAYMREVHAALADYRCTIEDLVEGDGRAAARARFEGVHRGDLLGFAPTGRRVAWTGAAFFTVAEGRLSDVWVIGDLDSLRRQLAEPTQKVE
ncbi:MAG TPA: ester cyclase [Caulobacteraceae bacterium]|jgi:predicted ester cyclase|nr:ester cyclase [Caulobacteraceae bacterium]